MPNIEGSPNRTLSANVLKGYCNDKNRTKVNHLNINIPDKIIFGIAFLFVHF